MQVSKEIEISVIEKFIKLEVLKKYHLYQNKVGDFVLKYPEGVDVLRASTLTELMLLYIFNLVKV